MRIHNTASAFKCSYLPAQDGADPVWELGPGGVLPSCRRQADLAREVWPGAGGGRRNPGVPRQAGINVLTAFSYQGIIFVVFETGLGIRGIVVRIRSSNLWIRIRLQIWIQLRIRLLSSVTVRIQKKILFSYFFLINLPTGT